MTIIPYTAEIYGYDYKNKLAENNYKLKEQKSFREVSIEVWAKK